MNNYNDNINNMLDLKKRIFSKKQRNVIALLRYNTQINYQNEILFEYIKLSFNKFKKGFIYYNHREPFAFCIWRIYEYLRFNKPHIFKTLHILLLGCPLEYIHRILDDIIYLCRKNNIEYITLEPANDILKSYYINCGFKERLDYGNIPILELDVALARYTSKPNSKFRIKTHKQMRYKLKNTKSHKN
jgi:hypothetical protein